MILHPDCVHYRGERPCQANRLCDGCLEYSPVGMRILIIKTAAAGDVLRTTSLLHGLRREYPDTHITWLTLPRAVELLEGNPLIDRVVPFDEFAWPSLAPRRFELLICLDKEPGPAGLAVLLDAAERKGFGLSPWGVPEPLNEAADYAFSLGLSDELKFRENKKSYHELIYEAAEIEYMRDEPNMKLEDVELGFARQAWLALGVDPDGPIIGLNTGAGSRFAGKALSVARTLELIEALQAYFQDETIVLLGGPEEEKKNEEIAARMGDLIVNAGCRHPVRVFAAMLTSLRILITGDTLALHLATALRVPVIALFGPTAAQEIDLFDRGDIIVSPLECVPCYLADCDRRPHCVDSIPVDQIVKSVGKFF